MAQFMLLLHESPAQMEMSPEEIGAVVAEYMAWRDKLAAAGRLVGGEKLTDEGGKWLTAGEGGVQVTDGPYSEAKEVLGGYFMIEAADYDEATEVSRDCPHLTYGGRIELRRIDTMH